MSSDSFSGFDAVIAQMLADDGFKKSVSGDVLEPISSSSDKQDVIKAALRCIFGAPKGVGTMTETSKHSHIKNKRNWQPFCARLLAYVKNKYPTQVTELEKVSGLFHNYRAFWPDCDEQLSKDVAKAAEAAKSRK
jgi:hypothetical protein